MCLVPVEFNNSLRSGQYNDANSKRITGRQRNSYVRYDYTSKT